MFKRLAISALTLGFILSVSTNAYAEKQQSELTVYSDVLASPLHYDIKTGDTLDLTILNRSNNEIKFTIPMLKNDITVEKNSKIVVPIDFSNPPEETISFFIQQQGSNRKDGTFKITDYSVPKLTSNVEKIDTSALKDIINYSKTSEWDQKYSTTLVVDQNTVVISEKDQPVKITTEEESSEEQTVKQTTPQKKRYIRGYW